jgi:hypothetical protein
MFLMDSGAKAWLRHRHLDWLLLFPQKGEAAEIDDTGW